MPSTALHAVHMSHPPWGLPHCHGGGGTDGAEAAGAEAAGAEALLLVPLVWGRVDREALLASDKPVSLAPTLVVHR